MKNEKGNGIIAIIIIILVVLFIACMCSSGGSGSSSSRSSSSSKYKTQYQKDVDHIANVYDMEPSDVDTKIKAVEKALKNM